MADLVQPVARVAAGVLGVVHGRMAAFRSISLLSTTPPTEGSHAGSPGFPGSLYPERFNVSGGSRPRSGFAKRAGAGPAKPVQWTALTLEVPAPMASSDDAPCRPCSLPFSQGALRWPEARWPSCVPAMAGHCAKWPAIARCTANRASPRSRNRCSRLPAGPSAGSWMTRPARAATRWCWCCRRAGVKKPCAVRPCAGAGRRRRPHRCLPVQQRRRARRGRPQAVGRPRRQPDQEPLPRVLDRPDAGPARCRPGQALVGTGRGAPDRRWPFLSRPGVFAWDRIDPASALLAEHLPADLAGRAADLGAGYGFVARTPGTLPEDHRAGPVRGRAARWRWPSSIWRRRRARCRCASCGRTPPPASSRATTSSSATRRSHAVAR